MKQFLQKHKAILIYLIFGVLTTVINYAVYLLCYNLFGWSATLSNILAWCIAVVFAFFTNKPFVFQSNDWSFSALKKEIPAFFGCRITSGAFETGILLLTVDYLHCNGNIIKVIVAIAVVIMNYIGSKVWVFHSKE